MTKRNWFITVISSGFGRCLTEQLLERGDVVVGSVRNKDKVLDLINQYPKSFICEFLDVTDTPAIRQIIDKTLKKTRAY